MTGIFVSYRRSDSEVEAGRLADQLQFRYGEDEVFFDRGRDTFQPGDDWLGTIEAAAQAAEVMVVVIGPTWLETPTGATQPRIFDDSDIVRLEIRTAIDRGARVVPVLLGDAAMPPKDGLPNDLKRLGSGQAVPIRTETFQRDADYLVRQLEPALSSPTRRLRRLVRANTTALTVAASVLVAAVAALVIARLVVGDEELALMGGDFNIAVAPFDASTLPETMTDGEDVGRSVGTAIAGAIDETAGEGTLVWGPDRLAPVNGLTIDDQRDEARQRATDHDADVIVHGHIEDNGLSEARLVVALTVVTPDQRRPVSPSVLQHAIERTVVGDVKRIDTAQDARDRLSTVDSLDGLLNGVRLLDDGDLDAARLQFETLLPNSGGDGSPSETNNDPDFSATVQALLGLAHLRLNEAGDGASLPAAVRALEAALELDPDFAFAEVTMLGARYLELLGGDPDTFDPRTVDSGKLVGLQDSVSSFAERHSPGSLIGLQARNLIGAVDLTLAERADALGDDPSELLTSAESAFQTVESAGDPVASPEQNSIITVARTSLGQIEFLRGRLSSAIEWYEQALETASPTRQFELRLIISGLLAQSDEPCEAAAYAESALGRLDDASDQPPPTEFTDFARRLADEQQTLCPAG